MVDTSNLVCGPAVKVGGRRIPTTMTRSKPQSSVEPSAKSQSMTGPQDSPDIDAAMKSTDDSGEDNAYGNNEVMRKKRRDKERDEEKSKKSRNEHRQRKEHTRPTRDAQSNFRAFASQRVVQPSGKAGGA